MFTVQYTGTNTLSRLLTQPHQPALYQSVSQASVKIFTLANSKQELSTGIIIRHSPLRNNRADTN